MRRHIGIVGAGIAGLHLALYLQKHGVDATLITDRKPEDYRDIRLHQHGRPPPCDDRARGLSRRQPLERPEATLLLPRSFLQFPGSRCSFRGDFSKPSRAVDYRIYLPALMKDFLDRGGTIEYRQIEQGDIAGLVSRYDLLVVSTGKGPLGQLFSLPAGAHAVFAAAAAAVRRSLCRRPPAGPDERNAVGFTGARRDDRDSDDQLRRRRHRAADGEHPRRRHGGTGDAQLRRRSRHFLQVLLGKLEKHHPTTYHRIDTARFDLAQPLDLLQGGVVPTVRNTVVQFDGGKCAIALGDLHSVVDPMMGQGANVASYAAFVLGEEIVKSDVLDARFCEKVDRKRQDRVLAAARWTNVMLQPPSEALGMLIGTMSQNQALADEFTENFNYPDQQWDRICSAERIHAWIERKSAPAPMRASA